MLSRLNPLKSLFLCAAIFLTIPAFSQTSGGSGSPWNLMGRKAEIKRQTRWSLDEWLATRERMKWSDMWLALNSPSDFEFFFLGAYNLVPINRGGKPDFRFGAGAYVKIFGLEYEHETLFAPEDHARFHLRLFGYHVQNTNLTFQAGIRFRNEGVSFRQGYIGMSTSIYLQKYFGLSFLYRYYFASVSVPQYGSTYGDRLEGGPFIDFGPLRVFGLMLVQKEKDSADSVIGIHHGWNIGGQLFF